MTTGDGMRAGRSFPVSDVIAAVACLAGSTGFFLLARALPAGHSTGDTGPGALPEQVGVFGIFCAVAYLVLALRGAFNAEKPNFSSGHRALAALAIFVVCLLTVRWIGLALAISIASGLVTLLFRSERRIVQAVATGVGVWLIAVLLFQKLLGLPLP